MRKPLKITEFEQVFTARAIQKGLSIFKNHQLQLVGKPGRSEYDFMIKNTAVHVKRQAELIIDYDCSCGKKNCEHLCAAILYFQKEIFENLLSKKNNKEKQTDLFKYYSQRIKNAIFSKSGVLKNQEQIGKSLNSLLRNKKHEYFFCLALMSELSSLPVLSIEDKEKLNDLADVARARFARLTRKKPEAGQVDALYQATLNSVTSSRRFNTGLFSFLVPYAALYIKDKSLVAELKQNLEKRVVKHKYPGALDAKLVALIHLQNAEHPGGNIKKGSGQNVPEFYIAAAERALCTGKNSEALKILKSGHEHLKQNKPAGFISYLELIIDKAEKAGDKEAELFFIRQVLIYDFQINPNLLRRINALLTKSARALFYRDVIGEIKKSHHDTFDKISVLFLEEENYGELIKEISKQQNRFKLLNEVAIKMLPVVTDSLLKVYVRQFHSALNLAPEHHYQQKIFENARHYFDKLPAGQRNKLISTIVSGLGGRSYLRQLILKTYSI